MSGIVNKPLEDLHPDPGNPREADDARMTLLMMSLKKLGFILPIYALPDGMILSGHQRLEAARRLGYTQVPVEYVDVPKSKQRGINILFNRVTNDMQATDTGSSFAKLWSKSEGAIDRFPNWEGEEYFALGCKNENIEGLGEGQADKWHQKAITIADNFVRMKIKIPIVVSKKGEVVNGIHRLFAARAKGLKTWPVIRIPNKYVRITRDFLNYLSMDYVVNEEFAEMLRWGAYRRPFNARGRLAKAYRFWANGERTKADKDSYGKDYWQHFRQLHGTVLDFGSGLSKAGPYLRAKGIDAIDFEPYRIPQDERGKPDPEYSRAEAARFIEEIADGRQFDSIFLASVLNSIPFPQDRMAVLVVVHALCSFETKIYGTCRDSSDFNYIYGGLRQPNYFVFDSEPGVRIADSLSEPKIQKFHTQAEVDEMFKRLWNKRDFWKGGNIFYFRLAAPKRVNKKVLRAAIRFEFDLPYGDGSRMGLVSEALAAFEARGVL